MAIKEPRYEKNRLKLHEHIPFKTPLALHIDVCSACNLKCNFCANHSPHYCGDYIRKYEVMNFELFKKIIDDIKEFESPIKSLRLYNIGEPLLNPKFSDMVKYAKQSGSVIKIDTTTNGVALTPEMSDKIIEAGLDFICFSIEAMDDEGYQKVANTRIDFKNLVENITYFYKNKKNCIVHVKTMNVAVPTEVEVNKFYDTFDSICDSMWIDAVTNVWPDFEAVEKNNIKNMYNQPTQPLIVCTQPFYNLSVNPDGTVTHCDLDWKSEFVIGDLKNQSLKQIWDSDIVRNTQVTHLKGERTSIGICSRCPWPENGCIDNFDNYRLDVLKRYK